ncbi:hypothetical protein [Pseudomonas atacamensis]|uniref:hypothetical protein n=1 Tax=Pseudomonas atacamensis TaxID=2565368 RepID=UPI0019D12F6E|nr:hypothetical protein [Pseudomonas atacamensis]QSL90445.1 hypothetical protein JWU58_26775 [Pseudomonas atacamensis]
MSQTKAVTINRAAGKAPRELADAIVAGQKTYPFNVTVSHQGNFPLVVPSTGLSTELAPREEATVKVKSYEQAWLLVTDFAEFADRAGNDSEEFATIVPALVEQETPVEPKKAEKPGKATTQPVEGGE